MTGAAQAPIKPERPSERGKERESERGFRTLKGQDESGPRRAGRPNALGVPPPPGSLGTQPGGELKERRKFFSFSRP